MKFLRRVWHRFLIWLGGPLTTIGAKFAISRFGERCIMVWQALTAPRVHWYTEDQVKKIVAAEREHCLCAKNNSGPRGQNAAFGATSRRLLTP